MLKIITSPVGKQSSISFNIARPIGNFSGTHFGGFAIEYSISKRQLGLMKSKPANSFSFIATGGFAYYFGKKETVSGYPYDYPGYFFIHAFGGVLYNALKKGSIVFTAGPGLGIYNGNTRFNLGSELELSYYISKKLAIGPGIKLMKESGSKPLLATAIKTTIAL